MSNPTLGSTDTVISALQAKESGSRRDGDGKEHGIKQETISGGRIRLTWKGTKIPRGAAVGGREVSSTQHGRVLDAAGKHLGTYERKQEWAGAGKDEHEMVITPQDVKLSAGALQHVLGRMLRAIVSVALLLTLAPTLDAQEYNRKDWGTWAKEDRVKGECRWDARQLLLRPYATSVRTDPKKPCLVLIVGNVPDCYTGLLYTGKASDLTVDHIVPLAEAHRSGGHRWRKKEKSAFFNDPANHCLTTRPVNSAKGDTDPGGQSHNGQRKGWWPPDESRREWYAKTWIQVKKSWGLSLDTEEAEAICRELERGGS